MSLELRAANNRVSSLAAEQAVAGAVRYIGSVLAYQISLGSNGIPPAPTINFGEAMQLGDSRFWLIGRDPNAASPGTQVTFGLVDEAGKLNLNGASSNQLVAFLASFARVSADFAPAILDWRDTNGLGTYQTYYAMQHPPYVSKSGPFETADEVRLVYGATLDILLGEDSNRNGVLDPGEDLNQNGVLDPGLIDYFTVYSREPASGLTNVNTAAQDDLRALMENNGIRNAAQLSTAVFGSIRPGAGAPRLCASPLDF